MPIRTYRDLDVYRESYAAALEVSRISKGFPRLEQVELARQLRRAARSVAANIVEGWSKRSSDSEFKRFLQVAIGSCGEVRLWLEMSRDEGYLSGADYTRLSQQYDRIGAMLAGLWRQWRGRPR